MENDLEFYRPKKGILDLEDEVIELWYGKTALKFVRLIETCKIVGYNDSIYSLDQDKQNYISYENKYTICIYNNDKDFILQIVGIIESMFISYDEALKMTTILTPIIKDLFNYEIKGIY